MVRLQKFLAEAGVASRRASEQYIVAGRVTVNGEAACQLGVKVDPGRDRVAVDGRVVRARRKLYVALHKPRGFVCTRAGEARDKIGDLLPREWNGLFSVGRLDCQSEGLIFLTNDGDFCLKLSHPRYGMARVYVASVEGRVTLEMLKKFTAGVPSAGENSMPMLRLICGASKVTPAAAIRRWRFIQHRRGTFGRIGGWGLLGRRRVQPAAIVVDSARPFPFGRGERR